VVLLPLYKGGKGDLEDIEKSTKKENNKKGRP
jgi:hypothetical protein